MNKEKAVVHVCSNMQDAIDLVQYKAKLKEAVANMRLSGGGDYSRGQLVFKARVLQIINESS